MAGAPSELRQVGHALADADNDRLRAVVALLDATPERGAADRVLDPVRPRLRRLRPRRPLGFVRLLFLPLDPVIVPGSVWQRGEARVPRHALAPLGAAVLAALGPAGQAVAARCHGHSVDNHPLVASLGADLWPDAAAVLPTAAPAGWEAAGLAATDFPPLRALIAPLLEAGAALHRAHVQAADGPPEAVVTAALADLTGDAFVAAVSGLLGIAAAPHVVIEIALSLAPGQRSGLAAAVEAFVDAPPPALATLTLAGAARAMDALRHRLDGIEASRLLGAAGNRRIAAARAAAVGACREHAREAAETELLAPLRQATAVDDATVEAGEAAARGLRRFTMAAGRLGGASEYDRLLHTTMDALVGVDGLGRVDQARLAEILLGPEAAAKVLGPGAIPR